METPEPVREHRELDKLAGHFSGSERMHPSYWNPDEKLAEAVIDGRVVLDGFAVVQDYEQRQEDGTRFAGHGVFRYDMPSDSYELHWFDSTGDTVRIFRGGFEGRLLVLVARIGEGWQRVTYDFNLRKGYRFKLETSDDGERWNLALEGDNLRARVSEDRGAFARVASKKAGTRKTATKRTTGSRSSAKKAPARKAAPKKKAVKKKAAKKATAKKAASKKAASKKAGAKKTASKKAGARRATGKKATGRKTANKTTARAAPKRKAGKKKAAKKTAAGKKTAGKAAAKKATTKKATTKKAAGKKAPARARPRVSAVERRRRQGKASKKIGTGARRKGATHRREDDAAMRSRVSQQKRRSGAQYGPRMPELKKTSTRVGWHKTAAKGKPGN